MRAASGIVPKAFEASGKATTRVRSVSLPLEVVEVEPRVVVDLDEADAKVEVVGELEPRRDVAVVVETRDEDLVAGASVRPSARVSAKLSVVMFWPKIVSSGRQPRKRAAVACACSTSSSLRRLAANAPPRFAFDSRRYARDRVDHGLRALRPARRVEVGDAGRERGEPCPDAVEVEAHPCSSGAMVNPRSPSCSQ